MANPAPRSAGSSCRQTPAPRRRSCRCNHQWLRGHRSCLPPRVGDIINPTQPIDLTLCDLLADRTGLCSIDANGLVSSVIEFSPARLLIHGVHFRIGVAIRQAPDRNLNYVMTKFVGRDTGGEGGDQLVRLLDLFIGNGGGLSWAVTCADPKSIASAKKQSMELSENKQQSK
jgi:hypothetical protein